VQITWHVSDRYERIVTVAVRSWLRLAEKFIAGFSSGQLFKSCI
jgi:hypothetical protein